jgi:hypothetical protein
MKELGGREGGREGGQKYLKENLVVLLARVHF